VIGDLRLDNSAEGAAFNGRALLAANLSKQVLRLMPHLRRSPVSAIHGLTAVAI